MTPPSSGEQEDLKKVDQDVTDSVDTSATEHEDAETTEAKPKSMLEAVMNAAKGEDDGESERESSGPENQGQTEGKKPKAASGEDEELGELTDEELATYKPKTAKRMRQLLEEKKKLTAALEEAGATPETLKTIKQEADRMVHFDNFVKTNNLSGQEVNTGMSIMAAMKNDPVKALEMLQPFVKALEEITGGVMPPDIQKALDEGRIDETYAQELARQRARGTLATGRAQTVEDKARQKEALEQSSKFADDMAGTITAWEKQWETSDPDYKLKAPRVLDKLQVALMKGPMPRNKKELIDLATKLKGEVDVEVKQFIPKKRQSTPVVPGSSVRSSPAPKNMLDVVKQTVQRAG